MVKTIRTTLSVLATAQSWYTADSASWLFRPVGPHQCNAESVAKLSTRIYAQPGCPTLVEPVVIHVAHHLQCTLWQKFRCFVFSAATLVFVRWSESIFSFPCHHYRKLLHCVFDLSLELPELQKAFSVVKYSACLEDHSRGICTKNIRPLLHFHTLLSNLAFFLRHEMNWLSVSLECRSCGPQVKTDWPERWPKTGDSGNGESHTYLNFFQR